MQSGELQSLYVLQCLTGPILLAAALAVMVKDPIEWEFVLFLGF